MSKCNKFKSWQLYLENTPTESIDNYSQGLYIGIGFEISKLRKESKESLVNFHKRIFGKQNFTWSHEEKLYVWIFDDFLLFIGKNKGIVIELFSSNASKEIALKALKFYVEKTGISKSLEDLHIDNYKYEE